MFDPNAGDPPADANAGDSPADPNAAPPADPNAGDPPAPDPNRPDYLLPKYNSVADQAKAYSDLYGQFSKKTEELKAELLPQVQSDWLKERGVPDAADGYKLPEGLEIGDENQGKAFMDLVHELGVGQEGFEKLAKMHAEAVNIDPAAEKAKLGDNADARIVAASRYAATNVPKEMHDKVADVMRTAAGVEVIEALMKASRASVMPQEPTTPTPAPKMTRAMIAEMKNDPRYYDPRKRDAAYVKQVDAAIEALVAGN